MISESVTLADLPEPARAQLIAHTGPIRATQTITTGRNSALSARISTDRGQWFIKGLPATDTAVATQEREYEISRHLHGTGPAARWYVHTGGWYLIGFDYLTGRHANYQPGSPDLRLVADLLHRLSTIPAPDRVPLRRAEERLAEHTPHRGALANFGGDHLAHTDPNPANVLVTNHAHLVDWAWATRAAAWLDTAYWVIWLITAGHTPPDAEATAAQVPAFGTAPPAALDAFAQANANLWTTITTNNPNPWNRRTQTAATAWAAHRHATSGQLKTSRGH